jgi:hypothetical protein
MDRIHQIASLTVTMDDDTPIIVREVGTTSPADSINITKSLDKLQRFYARFRLFAT